MSMVGREKSAKVRNTKSLVFVRVTSYLYYYSLLPGRVDSG